MILEDLLLIEPNWDTKVALRRGWSTSIQTSIVGGEKRSSLFTWPRKSLKFSLEGFSSAELAYLKRKLYKNTTSIFGVPFWMDRVTLTAQASSGQAILNVSTTLYRNFEPGGPCLVYSSRSSYEIATILSMSDIQIVLDSNLSSTWPIGTRVYPVLQASITTNQKISMVTSGIGKLDLTASEVLDEDIVKLYLGSISDYPTYKGLPVFDTAPNWVKNIPISVVNNYEELKFLGKRFISSLWKEAFSDYTARVDFWTKAELHTFNLFFDYMRGMGKGFYAPTWMRDIVVTSAISAVDTVLNIENIDYSFYWGTGWGTETYADNIALIFPDGTQVYREVVSAPTTTSLQLSSAVGKACPAEQLGFMLVCFLPVSRFNNDEVEIVYASEDVSTVSLRIRSIPLAASSSSISSSSLSSISSSCSSSSRSSSLSSSSSSSSSRSLSSSSSSSRSSSSSSRSSTSISSSSSRSSSSRSSSSSLSSLSSSSSSSSSRSSSSSSSSSSSNSSISSSSSSLSSSSSSLSSSSSSSSSSSRSSSSSSQSSSSCQTNGFVYDITAQALGSPPADWTEQWNTTVASIDVVADLGKNRIMSVLHTSNNWYANSWDDIGSPADVEVLARVRWTYGYYRCAYVVLRGSGTTNENGYLASFQDYGTNSFYLYKMTNGSLTSLGYVTGTLELNTWYWVRFRVEGTALKAKYWADGEAEPASWQIENTDATYASGWVGWGSQYYYGVGRLQECGYFSADLCGGDASLSSWSSSRSSSSSSSSSSSLSSSSSSSSCLSSSSSSWSSSCSSSSRSSSSSSSSSSSRSSSSSSKSSSSSSSSSSCKSSSSSSKSSSSSSTSVGLWQTDFDEYVVGTAPSDWTEKWNPLAGAITVRGDGDFGVNCLELSHVVGARYGAAWNDPGSRADVEILAKLRVTVNYDGAGTLQARGAGISGNEIGYFAGISPVKNEIYISKYTPVFTEIATLSKSITWGSWYYVRFNLSGTSLKLRVWAYGGSEPGYWNIITTDSSIVNAGWIGVGGYNNGADYDYFCVTNDGGTALSYSSSSSSSSSRSSSSSSSSSSSRSSSSSSSSFSSSSSSSSSRSSSRSSSSSSALV